MIEISPSEAQAEGFFNNTSQRATQAEMSEKEREYAYLLGTDLAENLFRPAIVKAERNRRRKKAIEVFRALGEY